MTFHDFSLHDDLLAGVDAMNYLQATPIQEQAIPVILEGQDLIACAQTGTGKTAAYLIPLLDKIAHGGNDHTSTLILVPTRELAKQIDEQVEGFSYFVSATSIAIYGGGKGENWDQQRRALTNGADIIIATPGRLMAHMQLGYVNFKDLNYLVLDEADKMLDMGFSDDILNIVRQIPVDRQTLMFSATMPNKIRTFAQRILKEPAEITLAVSKPAEKIDQQFYLAYDHQKLPLLAHLMQQTKASSMVLFTSHKSEINRIVRELVKLGFGAKGISSDSEQDEREAILRGFKNKQFSILVATDVLSRGIDIDNLSHVVNYDIPRDAEDYVHRIGRTARADTTGTAITFISDQDQDRIIKIERLLERQLEKRAITEELGLGTAPEFDPKRFSGLRAKRGKPGSTHTGRNGRPAASSPSGQERNPRRDPRSGPARPRPDAPSPAGETAEKAGPSVDENRLASHTALSVTTENGEGRPSPPARPEGEVRKKSARKNPLNALPTPRRQSVLEPPTGPYRRVSHPLLTNVLPVRCSLLTRLWLAFALICSSVCYAVSLPADTGSVARSVVVQSVVLAGNLRTQDRIILREMSLRKGDTIRHSDLPEKLLWDQRKIANTNLFVTVAVATRPVLSADTSLVAPIDVVVTVKERWYVFPALIFDIADRNFNEWWYDRHHDLNRTVYGARLDYRNFTGANDKFTAVVQLGFTRRLQLAYARPYIDRAQRTGLRADISESTNREVAYRTQFDKWLYGKGNGELRKRFTAGAAVTRRNGFFQFHTLELRYNRNAVADTVVRLNPDYFLNGHTRQRYFQLAYGFSYDRRDNVAYPLQGILFSAGATQYGLLAGDGLHMLEVAGSITRFWPLGGKFYVSNSVRGRMTLHGQQPYSSLRGLGNGQELVRGYELYVVDGQRYGLFKNSLKYQLFNTVRQLNWLHIRQFNTLPIAVYLTAFGDAGYVRSSVAEEYQSRLANRWLVGTGLGLDVVTFYNLVMRVSGSLNGQGQKGIFFNLTQGF